MTTTEPGNLEQDASRLYPVVEGSNPEQSAEFQRQQEEWRAELKSTEEDITTLRQLLDSKMRRSAELRRKLGLTPMAEIRHDLQEGIKAVREMPAVQRTNETLRGFGAAMSQRWNDLRNSQAMSRMGNAMTSAKGIVRSTTIDQIFSSRGYGESAAPTNGEAKTESDKPEETTTEAAPTQAP